MKRCTVEHLTFTRYSATTEFRCGGRLYFTVFRKSERIIEISPHLPKLGYRKNKSGTFLWPTVLWVP